MLSLVFVDAKDKDGFLNATASVAFDWYSLEKYTFKTESTQSH